MVIGRDENLSCARGVDERPPLSTSMLSAQRRNVGIGVGDETGAEIGVTSGAEAEDLTHVVQP